MRLPLDRLRSRLACCCDELAIKDRSLVVSVDQLAAAEDFKLRGIAMEVEAKVPEDAPRDHFDMRVDSVTGSGNVGRDGTSARVDRVGRGTATPAPGLRTPRADDGSVPGPGEGAPREATLAGRADLGDDVPPHPRTAEEPRLEEPSGDPDLDHPSAPKMVLLFRTPEGPREVTVRRRPLQLSFHDHVPVVVEKAEGHSKELGIERGWELAQLDGKPVQAEFEAFFKRFVWALQALPNCYCLPLRFQKPDGDEATVRLRERPVGLSFDALMPIVVREAFGHSQEIGVESGWTLLSFGSQDVSEFGSFDEFFTAFANHVAPLYDSRPVSI